MKSQNIGSRLLMAASLVEKGNIVCDVGCDHGKLSLYLTTSGQAQHIIATDINAMPLQKAIDLFAQHGLSDKADFYLTDGLQNLPTTQGISHVVIAGLGGETMAQIIENASFIAENKVTLVLLPAQSGWRIRQYLYENGFEILSEHPVKENKKYYSAIVARFCGVKKTPTVYQCYVGEISMSKDEATLGYLDMVANQLEKKVKGQYLDYHTCQPDLETAYAKVQQLLK